MPSLTRDPITGEYDYKDGADAVINETTGQTRGVLSSPTAPQSQPSDALKNLSIGLANGTITDQSQLTPTDDFQVSIPDDGIDSDALSSDTAFGDIYNRNNTYIKQFEDFQAQQQDFQQQLLDLSGPSEELQSALNDLNTVREDRQRLLDTSEDRLASLGSIRGEQAQVNRAFDRREQTAINRVNTILSLRGQKIDAVTKAYKFSQDNFNAFLSMQEMTRPETISTDIDPTTGEIFALIQDPITGQITQEVVGQVTPEVAGLDFVSSGRYVNGRNQEVFYGVTDSGEIIQQVLGSAKPTSGAGGGVSTTPTGTDIFGLSDGVVDVTDPEYVIDLLAASGEFTTNPVASERENLNKFTQVIAQTGNLISTLDKSDTGPIIGFLKGLDPYNFDARAVNAQLQALVPAVARGVYGEVGVLTDSDIRNYMRTLPTLTGTEEQNKFVALMTLKNAQRAFETSLRSMANSRVNVSGWVNDFRSLNSEVERLEDELGVTESLAQTENGPVALDQFLEDEQDGDRGFFGNVWNSFTNFFGT